MSETRRPDIKYLPKYCRLRQCEVWAIITRQEESGTIQVVNCLDKSKPCYWLQCVFAVKGGQWPFSSKEIA